MAKKLTDQTTLLEFLEIAQEFNAGTMKLVMRKRDNTPTAAFIVINGTDECNELLPLIEEIEEKRDWQLVFLD